VTVASDLRNLSDTELDERLQEAYQELLNLRFRKATKQLDNTARIRVVRRSIARIKTILHARALETESEVPGA